MFNEVKVPRALLATLCALLLVSLVVVGFLVGRQSSPAPIATKSPTAPPPPLAVEQPVDQSLDARLDALDKRIAARQNQVGRLNAGPQPNATPSVAPSSAPTPRASEAELKPAYFQEIEGIVGGSSAIADPQPMGARLLQQAMGGDESRFDSVIKQTEQAKSSLESVKAPPSCEEHRALLLQQLTDALALLKEVRSASASGETEKLSKLVGDTEQKQNQARRLRELDASLRKNL